MNKITKMDDKKMNKNIRKLEKQEDNLINQMQKCRETKCSKKFRIKEKEEKIFEKEQDKRCPKNLTNDEFYNCSKKFYKNSEYKKIYDEYAKCGETNCKIYKKKLHSLRDKLLVYDMIKITKMENKTKKTNTKKSNTKKSNTKKSNTKKSNTKKSNTKKMHKL